MIVVLRQKQTAYMLFNVTLSSSPVILQVFQLFISALSNWIR